MLLLSLLLELTQEDSKGPEPPKSHPGRGIRRQPISVVYPPGYGGRPLADILGNVTLRGGGIAEGPMTVVSPSSRPVRDMSGGDDEGPSGVPGGPGYVVAITRYAAEHPEANSAFDQAFIDREILPNHPGLRHLCRGHPRAFASADGRSALYYDSNMNRLVLKRPKSDKGIVIDSPYPTPILIIADVNRECFYVRLDRSDGNSNIGVVDGKTGKIEYNVKFKNRPGFKVDYMTPYISGVDPDIHDGVPYFQSGDTSYGAEWNRTKKHMSARGEFPDEQTLQSVHVHGRIVRKSNNNNAIFFRNSHKDAQINAVKESSVSVIGGGIWTARCENDNKGFYVVFTRDGVNVGAHKFEDRAFVGEDIGLFYGWEKSGGLFSGKTQRFAVTVYGNFIDVWEIEPPSAGPLGIGYILPNLITTSKTTLLNSLEMKDPISWAKAHNHATTFMSGGSWWEWMYGVEKDPEPWDDPKDAKIEEGAPEAPKFDFAEFEAEQASQAAEEQAKRSASKNPMPVAKTGLSHAEQISRGGGAAMLRPKQNIIVQKGQTDKLPEGLERLAEGPPQARASTIGRDYIYFDESIKKLVMVYDNVKMSPIDVGDTMPVQIVADLFTGRYFIRNADVGSHSNISTVVLRSDDKNSIGKFTADVEFVDHPNFKATNLITRLTEAKPNQEHEESTKCTCFYDGKTTFAFELKDGKFHKKAQWHRETIADFGDGNYVYITPDGKEVMAEARAPHQHEKVNKSRRKYSTLVDLYAASDFQEHGAVLLDNGIWLAEASQSAGKPILTILKETQYLPTLLIAKRFAQNKVLQFTKDVKDRLYAMEKMYTLSAQGEYSTPKIQLFSFVRETLVTVYNKYVDLWTRGGKLIKRAVEMPEPIKEAQIWSDHIHFVCDGAWWKLALSKQAPQ